MSAGRGEDRFDELVDSVVPRIMDEALEQAVDRAREELRERFARAIVDRALQTGAGPAATVAAGRPRTEAPGGALQEPVQQPNRESAPPSGPTAETGLYAFGIVPAGPVDLAGVAGIDGEAPLRIVQHDELGLVVSRMRLDLMDDVSETDLSETGALATLARRHDEVVRHVFERGPVLPLRFGTVVADEEGARRLLAEHRAVARARLAHLDGHREWGVRLAPTAEADADTAVADDPSRAVRHEMSGTDYLASRREALGRSQRAERHAAALTGRVEETLTDHAVDVTHRGGAPGLVADLAYLVAVGQESQFRDAAERLRTEVAREGLDLTLTGPWPPYSFAALESSQGSGRSAGHA